MKTKSSTVTPHQRVTADKLVKGDIILFHGGIAEVITALQRKRGNHILVQTAEHPNGILARAQQSITITITSKP